MTSATPVPPALVPRARVEVCVVLVVRDGARRLGETLDALATSSLTPDRLIVLDLGSSDASAEIADGHARIREVVPRVSVVTTPRGLSVTTAIRQVLMASDGTGAAAGTGASDRTGAPAGTSAADGVDPAAPAEVGTPQWLWFLGPDSGPAQMALARLVDAVGRSPSVGVAGPKIVEWGDPRRLVSIGRLVTRAGRLVEAPVPGEPDQGQYDGRTDVLAVSTNGMFVRRDVYDSLDGLDGSFGAGADLDFGWRAQLSGHRVVVVPAARVCDATTMAGRADGTEGIDDGANRTLEGDDAADGTDDGAGRPDAAGAAGRPDAAAAPQPTRPGGPFVSPVPSPRPVRMAGPPRRAARRVALVRCAPWTLPVLAGWIAISSVISAAALLVLKRPAHAWVALGELGSLVHPLTGIRSRWRFRGHQRVRRAHLAGVFVSPGAAVAHTWDKVQDALTPDRSRRSDPGSVASGATETGPVAEEAEDLAVLPASVPQRIAAHPGTLGVLLCLVVTAVLFRTTLRTGILDPQGAGLAGGELNLLSTDAAGLWHLFRDAWHGAGFGTDAVVGPQVGVLAALVWLVERLPSVSAGRSPAGVTLAWLLLAAMPLSGLTAYLAGRVATVSRWPRALAAIAWGTSGGLAAALGGGRLSVVVAHVVLPFVVAGFAAVAARVATWTGTFATALAGAVVGCFVPVLAVLMAIVALAMVALASANRRKAVVLLLVPLLLLGPWVLRFVDDPRLLLTGGGLLDVGGGDTAPWQLAMGQPDGAGLFHSLLFAPLALAAVLALARRSRHDGRSPALTSLAVLALVGLAVALAAQRVTVGQVRDVSGTPVVATLWSGVGLEIYVAAVLGAFLTGWQGLSRLLGESRWQARRLVIVTASTVLVLSVLGAAALTARNGLGNGLTVGRDALPAVAVDQARGAAANRLLVLAPGPAELDYQLVGAEPGPLQRDVIGPVATDPGLAVLVGDLASGVVDPSGPGAGARLADQGIGFVSLRADVSSTLARTLDTESGLTRLGTTDDQTLWRVLARTPTAGTPDATVEPSRVRVTDGAGAPLLGVPVIGPHGAVDTRLPAGDTGRRLVVAEAPEWARFARVTYDDLPLSAVSTSGFPTYALPSAGGRLVVDLPPAHRDWFLLQMALLAVVIFLAIPFGTRRSRRTS